MTEKLTEAEAQEWRELDDEWVKRLFEPNPLDVLRYEELSRKAVLSGMSFRDLREGERDV